jgi:TatD DNase family protein
MPSFRRIDIHSHLNFAAFDADRDAAAKRALDGGTAFITVGTQLDTSRSAVALAERNPEGAYAIVGLHPIHTSASFHDEKELGEGGKEFTSRDEEFDAEAYRELLKHPKVVGIGECGLDYYRLSSDSIARQKEAFIGQIALAKEFKKPLMLHIREAYGDALEILAAHPDVKGNAHFFAGTLDEAKRFLDLGFTLSFTGVITFAKQYEELVRFTPLDMVQAETDCPFVAPVPHRGKRNEPAYVSEVVAAIARIKGLPLTEVEEALLTNARRVFGIKLD